MKLKDLLKCPWQDIAKLTDAELHEICKPYFHISRPSEAAKNRGKGAEGSAGSVAKAFQVRAASTRGQTNGSQSGFAERAKKTALYEEMKKKAAQMGLPFE